MLLSKAAAPAAVPASAPEEPKVDVLISKALEMKEAPWNGASIAVVGEGRCGKTSVIRMLLGESIDGVTSTIGIEKHDISAEGFTVKMDSLVGGKGGWKRDLMGNAKLFEREVAKQVVRAKVEANAKVKGKTDETATAAPAAPTGNAPTSSMSPAAPVAPTTPIAPAPSSSSSPLPSGLKGKANAPMAFEAVAVMEVDNEDVMKHIDANGNDSAIRYKLFDYSGQAVFYAMHHSCIKRNCFYIIVFNLCELLSPDEAVCKVAIEYLQFWIQAITIHTFDSADNSTAPVVFVGTHKDMCPDPADHDKASTMILKLIENSHIRHNMVSNEFGVGKGGVTRKHVMFPVDCKKGYGDPTISLLLPAIDLTISIAPYVTQLKPVSWYDIPSYLPTYLPTTNTHNNLIT